MDDNPRLGRASGLLVLTASFALSAWTAAGADIAEYRGRALAEALEVLQAKGLRIVFTSATVKPGMRVDEEPRAPDLRGQLDELLAPHGLETRDGPKGIVEVVRAKTKPPAPASAVSTRAGHSDGADADGPASLPPVPGTHREHVTVTGPVPYRFGQAAAHQSSLDRRQLDGLYGSLADDPMRAVHELARVTPVDEFRSEFAIRGTPFRQIDLVIDGVPTHWLQHTTYGRGATGSLAMFPAQVIGEATLRAGAYPRRHGDRLGPQLDLTIREGARSGFRMQGGISNSTGTLAAEGPRGDAGRGSWLIAARHSYMEWPTERADSRRTAFGFVDGLAKLVYDVRPTQRLAFTALGGTANVDGEDNVAPTELADGTSRAWAANLSWRSTLTPALVLEQRASVVRHDFLNRYGTGRTSDRGTNEEVAYRADVTRSIGAHLLEAGAVDGQRLGGRVASAPGTAPPRGRGVAGAAARTRSHLRPRHRAAADRSGPLAGDRLRPAGRRHPARARPPRQAGAGFAHSTGAALRQRAGGIVARHRAPDRAPWPGRAVGLGSLFVRTHATHRPRTARNVLGGLRPSHAITISGGYRVSPRASVGATFRSGSNFPIPGYLERRGDSLAVGTAWNAVRLPLYARLDLRADRQVEYFGRRLRLFAEVLNVLDRANVGLAGGTVDGTTGDALGVTDRLFRRRVVAGLLVEF